MLAQGSPAQVRELGRTDAGHEPGMDDAFIAVVERARDRQKSSNSAAPAAMNTGYP
jgi:hypothetical protein